MLPARSRLRSGKDFASAIRGPGGARAGNKLLVVHLRAAEARSGLPPRVGFVVSRAVGGAVVRNRVKRRLRAICAGTVDRLPLGVDAVVRASPSAAEATYAELSHSLDGLLDRLIRRMAAVS